ncbi:MAG TPA: tRNA epoxyqueuosine(34) reductase QueG [Opitutaceae bacterium]|nr:tRNA epoxyqueuosine(34) reductase QueG [Opitutaceae bacterium]
MNERQEILRRRLEALGFDEVRFASLQPRPAGGLRAWLAAGYQADMGWMERTAEKRLDPQRVLPGAVSVIALGVNYWSERRPEGQGRAAPVWARYALHRDYHDTFKPALVAAGKAIEESLGAADSDYRYYADTGPVLERGWAARAGLGFIGKNAMLISRQHGNWLLLGAILTRLPLEADPPPGQKHGDDVGVYCGKCTRCLGACPTQAFPAPGVVDSRRCISYQTIENRGHIPEELRPGIGLRVFGCDVCLDVCPWNRFAREGRRTLLAAREEITRLSLRDLLELTPDRFRQAFKGTPIFRGKLAGLLRNACVAAGNSGDTGLLGPLQALAQHESEIVREHARWAIGRLQGVAEAGGGA